VGVIRNNSFATEGGYFDTAYRLANKQAARFSWIENRRDDVRAYSQSKLNASGIPRSVVPYEERGIGKASFDARDLGRWSTELRLYSYFEHFRSPRDVDVESTKAFNLTHTVSSQAVFGGGAQNISGFSKSALVYGLDYRSEDLFSEKLLFTTTKSSGQVSTTVPSGNVPPGSYSVFDAFALNRWQPIRKLTLSLAGRIESIHLKSNPRPEDALTPFTVADLTQDRRWNPATGSIGAVYNAFGPLNLAVNIASSFRAPSFSDMLSTGVPLYASGIATVPSPGIKPERAISYEAGPRWASRHLNFNATAYWTSLSDVVVAQNSGTIDIPGIGVVTAQTNTNSDTGYMQGAEIAGAFHANSQWSFIGNYTFTRGQDTFKNVRLRFVPPQNGMVGALWDSPHRRYWSEGTVLLVDRMRHHAPNDELDAGFSADPGYGSPSATNPPYRPGFQIPGYAVANFRLGAKLFRQEKRGLDLTLDVNNLLNQPYREAYSQQELLAPGFGAVIGSRWIF
jgi:outer membrane receptor protein involved in Fe transport